MSAALTFVIASMLGVAHTPPMKQVCIAAAVRGEARGEPVRGQRLVAAVVHNRVAAHRWPDTACAVVFQPRQFQGARAWLRELPFADPAWKEALHVAARPASGSCARATHFTRTDEHARWMRDLRVLCVVGQHKFMGAK